MNVAIGVKTDVGRMREANEDAYLAEDPLFAVADGMGGHLAGDVASSTAVEVITDHAGSISADRPDTIAALLRDANKAIWDKASSDPSLAGMGTTCTLVLLDEARAHIAHVGDSRAYLFRRGELSQLTEDHTLVGRMVREGRLQPEEAEHHPQRSIITRALGVDADVKVDLHSIDVSEGDRLLLCSDGLSGMVDEATIVEILSSENDPQSAAERLVDVANAAGGEDNITVLVVDITDGASTGQTRAVTPTETPPPPPPTERSKAQVRATEPARPPSPEPTSAAEAQPRDRRWPKAVGWTIVLALLAAGAYFAARYALDNSWFIGVNGDGRVTIYRGIPEEIGGLAFKEPEEEATITVTDLPASIREDVRDGIRADSLQDARTKLSNLEDRARDFRDAGQKKKGAG